MVLFANTWSFVRFVGSVARATVSHPPPVERTIEEAFSIGVRSLPILLVISTFVGTNLTVQGYDAFRPLGGQSLVGMFVALAGIREMAPIMVASMVAAKAGTEMASQIAVMRIQEQIDAIEVMAIDPYWYLVTPRLFGILLVLPALTIMSIVSMMVAALLVARFQLGLDAGEFVRRAAETTSFLHIGFCALKAFCFGGIICLVSCWCGFVSGAGPAGVGRATNVAVVASAVSCAILNYLLSAWMFGR